METIETRKEMITMETHVFRCDDCNKILGKSEEYEDGYYDTFGEVEYHFNLGNSWYLSRRTLCEQCKKKYHNAIIDALNNLGFTKNLET